MKGKGKLVVFLIMVFFIFTVLVACDGTRGSDKDTFTIQYENTFGANNVNPTTYKVGDGTTTLEDLDGRLGYKFIGWYVDANKETRVDELAEEVISPEIKNIILYAGWETLEYTITYEDVFELANPNASTYNIETATIVLEKLADLSGFTFVGWYKERTGGEKVEEIPKGSTGDVILYARWDVATYTITYENTFGLNNDNPKSFTVNSVEIILVNLANRPDYNFVGWYNLPSGGEKVEKLPKGSIGNKTLYARWEAVSYSIIYNNTRGLINNNPKNYTKESDTIVLQDLEDVFGRVFLGWYTTEEGGEKVIEIAKGSSGDIILYARWEDISYKINYENTFGLENENPTSFVSPTYISLVSLADRPGYKFSGWYEAETGGIRKYAITSETGDITLYARWELKTYQILYREAYGINSNPITYTIETETIILEDLADLEWTYQIFVGWYQYIQGEAFKVEEIPKGSYGDITLYAHWEYIEFTITYEDTFGVENNNPTTFTYDSAFDLEELTGRVGYDFLGFYFQPEGGYEVVTVAYWGEDTTLYARWKPIKYSIAYVLNEGENNPDNPATYTIVDLDNLGGKFSLLSPLRKGFSVMKHYTHLGGGVCDVTRETTKYVFEGWYQEAGHINEVKEITIETENITLYAKWSIQLTEKTAQEFAYKIMDYILIEDEIMIKQITFGEYPQTIKAANVTIDETAVDERGYYLGSDGCYYAQVLSTDANYEDNTKYKFSNGELIVRYQRYYFKVEPIKWRVIYDYRFNNQLDQVLLHCEEIIDRHDFRAHDGRPTPPAPNNYEFSDIRAWLNDEFLNIAFSDIEREFIKTTLVNNSASTTNNPENQYACNDTEDYVFLLSYQAVIENPTYGFSEEWNEESLSRQKAVTDYLWAKSLAVELAELPGYLSWWLRSPHDDPNNNTYISTVRPDGSLSMSTGMAYGHFSTWYGVAPALTLQL